jgi:hypothetical protein
MVNIGKLALFAWAIGLVGVGLRLVQGQAGVMMTAIEAGRLSEALILLVFITLVFMGVGVLRE